MPNNHLVQPTILLLPNSSTSQVLTSAYISLPGKKLNVKVLSFLPISHIQSMNMLPLSECPGGKKRCSLPILGSHLGFCTERQNNNDEDNKFINMYISYIGGSILAWRIPWMEEPGGLQSMGSQRVRHDWATNPHTHISHVYMEETQGWITQEVA